MAGSSAAWSARDRFKAARFGNDVPGFATLRAGLPQTSDIARVVYVATGSCHAALERRFGAELSLIRVNPLQARRFAQSTGLRVKTDAVDARLPAPMGAAPELAPQAPVSETLRELKELRLARQAPIKDQTRLLTRIKTRKPGLVVKQGRARMALIRPTARPRGAFGSPRPSELGLNATSRTGGRHGRDCDHAEGPDGGGVADGGGQDEDCAVGAVGAADVGDCLGAGPGWTGPLRRRSAGWTAGRCGEADTETLPRGLLKKSDRSDSLSLQDRGGLRFWVGRNGINRSFSSAGRCATCSRKIMSWCGSTRFWTCRGFRARSLIFTRMGLGDRGLILRVRRKRH